MLGFVALFSAGFLFNLLFFSAGGASGGNSGQADSIDIGNAPSLSDQSVKTSGMAGRGSVSTRKTRPGKKVVKVAKKNEKPNYTLILITMMVILGNVGVIVLLYLRDRKKRGSG